MQMEKTGTKKGAVTRTAGCNRPARRAPRPWATCDQFTGGRALG
jgi:hypothetical protein